MGYLDNSTIVVDAILTKQGRKLISQGSPLNISYFTLTDTGVDYTLWNPDHPSGSAYYGEAIENLPQLEALPNAAYFMRNKLMTLNKDTVSLPLVDGVVDHNFGQVLTSFTFVPKLLNHKEDLGFQMIVPDESLIQVTRGRRVDIGGNALTFINEQDIPNAALYEGTEFEVTPKIVTADKTITVTFVSISTGTYKSAQLTIQKNDTEVVLTKSPQG